MPNLLFLLTLSIFWWALLLIAMLYCIALHCMALYHIVLYLLQAHWWAVLLIAIGVVVLMGLFIQLCAVHTPSSNPNKPPPRKMSLRRQHRPRQQVRHPQQRARRHKPKARHPKKQDNDPWQSTSSWF